LYVFSIGAAFVPPSFESFFGDLFSFLVVNGNRSASLTSSKPFYLGLGGRIPIMARELIFLALNLSLVSKITLAVNLGSTLSLTESNLTSSLLSLEAVRVEECAVVGLPLRFAPRDARDGEWFLDLATSLRSV
jgi:hypothetical protein